MMRKSLVCKLLGSCVLLLSMAANAETAAVVVAGLGGNPQYAESFEADSTLIAESLRSVAKEDQHITHFARDAARNHVLEAIESQGALTVDTFVLVLLGHGSVDARNWRFNLTGPDLTTEDLVSALATVNATRQVIIVAASASGALLKILEQPGRVVITATKSGGELNAVRFPGWLAEAMGSTKADTDRNEILTVAEAFRYANQKTREYYEERKLLASEHARLSGDDAGSITLVRLGSLAKASDDLAVAKLLDERLILEESFRQLRARKSELPIDDYYQQLETLLLSIATLQQSIDTATGWSDPDANS
ncbi:MAG: hypothetical protein V3U76_14420 [Granulosicoccus sp.]